MTLAARTAAAAPNWSARTDDLLEEWFGRSLPGRVDGGAPLGSPIILHIAAVAPVDGVRHVLRIDEKTPRSAVDFYLLNASRAWADIVVTSGKILRDEPELSYALGGPNPEAEKALIRARQARKQESLRVGVLSSGSGLDGAMPVWTRGGRFTLITDPEGRHRSRAWAESAGLEVVPLAPVGPREAVEWALASASPSGRAGRVSVELGTKSSVHLYAKGRRPALVDVLVLSEYLGPVPEGVRGDRFLDGVDLENLYTPGRVFRDGDWRFRFWLRRETLQ